MRTPIIAAVTIALVAVPVLGSPALAGKPKCNGKVATIVGTNGRDTIYATNKADVIVAKGGKDKIKGRGGNDTICAGGGDDWIQAGGGKDKVFGGNGNDVISGNDKNDKLFGGNGKDNINGGPGADIVKGEGHGDLLTGGRGNDIVGGGLGPDDVQGGLGSDKVYGGDGNDRLVGDEGVDVLNGGNDIDRCVDDFVDSHVNCEVADLKITVTGPPTASVGVNVPFVVKVTNNGPDPMSYTLVLDGWAWLADCSAVGSWEGRHKQPVLDAGNSRQDTVEMVCSNAPTGSEVRVTASTEAHGTDPDTWDDSPTASVPLQ